MHAIERQAQVLIVDRDNSVATSLRIELEHAGHEVRVICDKEPALAEIALRPPHLVIVEWDLPRHGGLELIEAVRMANPPHGLGLIILSGLAGESDVVSGLDLGADDYIAKPYSPREVVARTGAVLRARARRQRRRSETCGDWVLDAATNSVSVRQRLLTLSPAEYRLLAFLIRHPGRAFKRAQLLEEIWGMQSNVDERTVDVNVQRLRKALTGPGYETYIQTVRGFGYRFSAPLAQQDEKRVT